MASKPPPTFTPCALKVLALARHEAESRGHDGINDLHLLLGLFDREQETVASLVLKGFKLDPAELKEKFAADLQPGTSGKQVPFASVGQEVIDRAMAESVRLQHSFVGTEHLLLGILQTKGRATQWLEATGVEPEAVRTHLLEQIPTGFATEWAGLTGQSSTNETPGLLRRVLNFFKPSERSLPEGMQETMTMSENLTPRAGQILALAREQAMVRGHVLIEDAHLLLGLCEYAQGVAVNVMVRLGFDWHVIKENTMAALDKIPGAGVSGPSRRGPIALKVFTVARQERLAMHHTYLGTEHILLGLLQAGGVAVEVIGLGKFDIEEVRMAIMQELDPNFSEAQARLLDEATTLELIPCFGEEFTPRAKQALQAAQTESKQIGLPSVGALQVLAGLLTLGQGVAVNVLQQHGVTLERVRAVLEKTGGPEASADGSRNIPYTLAAYDAICAARQEALKLDHTYTGVEHLLLALLQSEADSLVSFFKEAGVDREAMWTAVLAELGGNTG